MRTLTVTSTGLGTTAGGTLKTLTIGNTGLAEGDGSQIDIKTTGITSLDISTFTKLKSIVVTGNTSMTAFTFPAGVTTATNVVGYLAKTITVEDNFIAGVFSAGASQTQSSAFVETSFTSVGITNAIAWITFSNNEDTTTSGQITFTIEVDQVGTVINQAGADTASAGTLSSAIWDNNDHINTLAELGLLPN